jgi:hypothetical protein
MKIVALVLFAITTTAVASGIDWDAYNQLHPDEQVDGAFSDINDETDPPVHSLSKNFKPPKELGYTSPEGKIYRRGGGAYGPTHQQPPPYHPDSSVLSAGADKPPCDGDGNTLPMDHVLPSSQEMPYDAKPEYAPAPAFAVRPAAQEMPYAEKPTYAPSPALAVRPGSQERMMPYVDAPLSGVLPSSQAMPYDDDCDDEGLDVVDDCDDEGLDVPEDYDDLKADDVPAVDDWTEGENLQGFNAQEFDSEDNSRGDQFSKSSGASSSVGVFASVLLLALSALFI